MTGATHIIAAAAIYRLNRLATPLALVLAFISHFFLDAIPHYELGLGWNYLLAAFACIFLISKSVAERDYKLIIAGLLGVLPDLIWMLDLSPSFYKIHNYLHFNKDFQVPFQFLFIEMAFSLVFIWFITKGQKKVNYISERHASLKEVPLNSKKAKYRWRKMFRLVVVFFVGCGISHMFYNSDETLASVSGGLPAVTEEAAVPPWAGQTGLPAAESGKWVSVKDPPYNVKGDGYTNDTTAINYTINEISASGGGIVYFPDGIYIAINIEAKSNVTCYLADGATIKAPAEQAVYDVLFKIKNTENFAIIGGTIDGNRFADKAGALYSEWRHGVLVLHSTDILIKNTLIKDTGGDGIILGDNGGAPFNSRVTIEHVVSENNKRQGLTINGADTVKVIESVFRGSNGSKPEDGIDIEPNSQSTICKNIEISGCSIYNNAGCGIESQLFNTDNHSGINIRDCYINGNGRAGCYLEDVTDMTIHSCNIHDNKLEGLLILQNCKNVNIINNRIHSNMDHGIYLSPNKNISSWKKDIAGQYIITKTFNNILIDRNIISNTLGRGSCAIKAYDGNTSTKINNLYITNNTIYDDQLVRTQKYTLSLSTHKDVHVKGNNYSKH